MAAADTFVGGAAADASAAASSSLPRSTHRPSYERMRLQKLDMSPNAGQASFAHMNLIKPHLLIEVEVAGLLAHVRNLDLAAGELYAR
jgi:hypothetical protein